MKRVAVSILFVLLALGLSTPVSARTKTTSKSNIHETKSHETKEQKKANERWEKQQKKQAKQVKKQAKAQDKQNKKWNRAHGTRTVT